MRNMLMLGVLVCGLLVQADTCRAAEAATGMQPAAGATTPAIQSPEMNLQFDNALPANFRGGDPDSTEVHVLEDQPYKRQEHTLLYEDTPQGMGAPAGATFEGPPTINWTTDRVGADGSVQTISNDNNNKATSESEFPEPGEYRVGNSGARQVSGSGGGASNTSGSEGQSASSAGSGTSAGTAGSAAAGSQRVTSTQTTGVVCHDVTSPNVWAVFQEAAGNTQAALDETELQQKLSEQLLAAKGQFDPAAPVSDALKGASMLAISEFPVNRKPAEKTAAVAVKGPLFNEVGKDETKVAATVAMKVLDAETQTRLTEVGATSSLKGIFVRRNVPFIVVALATDNGDKCTTAAGAVCRIETTDGTEVDKDDSSYMFRVPNYPRNEYKDQPEYQFVMEGADKDGNKTVVRLPLYVVNTQMAVEGGRNE
ncbi:MAG TPA: hypothetical protein PLU72_02450 [Candidatus Ozemobacteraceae bacterium]|nr:hypothetical protein [Candidatus Ozemobacteraceae bacterium]